MIFHSRLFMNSSLFFTLNDIDFVQMGISCIRSGHIKLLKEMTMPIKRNLDRLEKFLPVFIEVSMQHNFPAITKVSCRPKSLCQF